MIHFSFFPPLHALRRTLPLGAWVLLLVLPLRADDAAVTSPEGLPEPAVKTGTASVASNSSSTSAPVPPPAPTPAALTENAPVATADAAPDPSLALHGGTIKLRDTGAGETVVPPPAPVTATPDPAPSSAVASAPAPADNAPAPAPPVAATATPAPVASTPPAPSGTVASVEAATPVVSAPAPTDPAPLPVADSTLVASARTESAAPSAPAAAASPSSNAMANLINLLVAQKTITRDAGDTLIRQAEQEAETVRIQAAATQAAADRAVTAQTAVASAPAPAPASNAAPAASDEVQVTYVPDIVKKQIRDEVTADVLKQTQQDEVLGAKNDVPDWVKRYRVSGDIRVRYEGDFFPPGNAIGNFPNFNAINTGSGFVVGSSQIPQYNVDQDRERFRFRTRIGAEVDLGQNFSVGLRLGSGADDSPVTENQTFGLANNGQGGDFSKYAVWLDRAYIRYEYGSQADKGIALTVGRFDNPFFHTSMIWADDLGFDGAAVQASYKVNDSFTPFFVAGGFPVFNTDLNFSTNQSAKFSSYDKYLFATQLGGKWNISKEFSAKGAAAYYHYINIEGQVSSPIYFDSLPGNTDDSRPSFAQNGNTYIELRNYQDPTNPSHVGETQYFGLATPFHELALTGQLDYSGLDPFHIWLTGEFVDNLAFDRNSIINNGSPNLPGPVNNLSNGSDPNSFIGGNIGYLFKFNVGKVALEQLWDWNVAVSYRYIESDATVDGFNDSDFGASLAGTNLQGYTVGGNLALSPRVWLGLRWMSANAIAGPTYKNDLIQFDINAKF